MHKIEQRYLIHSPIEKVWNALTNPRIIEKWSGSPAVMNDEVGFEFSLWNGDIYGKNLEVDKPANGKAKLVQEWYGGEWETPSLATFLLNSDDHTTEVILIHKDLPKAEIKEFDEGWKDYYLGPIKKHLES